MIMKILTGQLRGQSIFFKPNPKIRPTSDKVRKALFDGLQGQWEGKRVLDLFSGTGALGFEALSNGAERVTFVESNQAQADRLKDNLKNLGISGAGSVLPQDVFRAIQNLSAKQEAYDIIFIDPPYEEGLGVKALEALSAANLVRQGALVILECYKKENFPEKSGMLTLIKVKVYGDTKVGVFESFC